MSERIPPIKRAFPSGDAPGMNLTDYFAGHALAGLCANPAVTFRRHGKYDTICLDDISDSELASMAYAIAIECVYESRGYDRFGAEIVAEYVEDRDGIPKPVQGGAK